MLIARNDGENKWNKQSGSIFTVNFQNPSVHVKKILHKPIAVSGPDLGTMHHGTNMHNTFVLPSFPQPLTKKLFVDSGCMYILTVCMYILNYIYTLYTLLSIPHLPICTSQQLLKRTYPFFVHQDASESFQEQHILIHGCSTLHLWFQHRELQRYTVDGNPK